MVPTTLQYVCSSSNLLGQIPVADLRAPLTGLYTLQCLIGKDGKEDNNNNQ